MTTVGIDIDGVLAGFVERAAELAKDRFGIDRSEFIGDYNGIWKVDAGDRKLGNWIFGEWREDIIENAPFIGNGFDKFASDARLQVNLVTSRGEDVKDQTQDWLDRNGVTGYSDLIFTSDKTEAPCQVLIDDHPKHVRSYQDNLRMGIIITKPYNRDEEFKYRAKDLHEAYETLTQFLWN